MKTTNAITRLLASIAAVCLFASCSNEDNTPATLSSESLLLYVGESSKLTYSGETCTWRSENSLIASVDNEGRVNAKKVGTTNIFANDLVCRVQVVSRYNNYVEPYTKWGSDASSINTYMTQRSYSLLTASNTSIVYNGDTKVVGYVYTLDNLKLVSSGMVVKLTYSSSFLDYIADRYVAVSVERVSGGDAYVFSSVDMKTFLAIQISTSGVAAAYLPMDSQKTRNYSDILREQLPKLEELPRLVKTQ